MGYFEPGDEVVFEYFRGTIYRATIANGPEHGSHSKVGHDHGISLSLRKENGVRVEVVGPFRVSFLTRNVKYCKSIGYQRWFEDTSLPLNILTKVRRKSENLLPD